jgi:hypothetical protein
MDIILKNYTIYKELVLTDLSGKVIADGRPEQYSLTGMDISGEQWFTEAIRTANGLEYSVQDVHESRLTGGPAVVYSAAVREDGATYGKAIGVLAVIFDWGQADYIVKNVRLTDEEKKGARIVLFNSQGQVIAASDGQGILDESVARIRGVKNALAGGKGFTVEAVGGRKMVIAYAHTPGYETYRGLGWGCAIICPVE